MLAFWSGGTRIQNRHMMKQSAKLMRTVSSLVHRCSLVSVFSLHISSPSILLPMTSKCWGFGCRNEWSFPSGQLAAGLQVAYHPSCPSSSSVAHRTTHSRSVSFTRRLNIDLNSFVSYWSATPPSAALNNHKDTHHVHTNLVHARVQMQHVTHFITNYILYIYIDIHTDALKIDTAAITLLMWSKQTDGLMADNGSRTPYWSTPRERDENTGNSGQHN